MRLVVDLRGVEREIEPIGVVGGIGRDAVDIEDGQIAVGDDRVAAAVARVVSGGEVLDDVDGHRRFGLGHGLDDVVAFDVGVLFDLVGDLQGEERETDALVIRARGEPADLVSAGQQPPLGRLPEADVVPLTRIAVDLLLIGEVLPPAEEEQRGDRGLRIALLRQRRLDDAPRRGGGDLVGEGPPGRFHRVMDLRLLPLEREIDGVAEQSVGRPRPPDEVVGDVDLREDPVQPGQGEVGDDDPEDEQGEQLPPSQGEALDEDEDGEERRGGTAEEEEEVVEDAGDGVPGAAEGERLPTPAPIMAVGGPGRGIRCRGV